MQRQKDLHQHQLRVQTFQRNDEPCPDYQNEGGEYVLKGSEADIFVTYASFHEDGTPWLCNREKYVDIALAEGKQIQKMTFDEFLSMLGMTNEELESLPLPPIDCLFREGVVIKDKKMKCK